MRRDPLSQSISMDPAAEAAAPQPAGEAPAPAPDPGKTLAIYAALLGREVRIEPDAPEAREPGVELRLKFDLNLKLGGTVPAGTEARFVDRVGQWAANAIRGIDAARRRLTLPRRLRSRPAEKAPAPTEPTEAALPMPVTAIKAKPVILVGPGVTRRAALRKTAAPSAHAA